MPGPFDPIPVFPFCPDQYDFLQTRHSDGFLAIDLNLIESFMGATAADGGIRTVIHLTNNNSYDSIEDVPTLVARYAAIKRARYDRDRQERFPENPLVSTSALTPPTGQDKATPPLSGSAEQAPPVTVKPPVGGIQWRNNT